ncbi:hypothetical protein B0O80DRAFT_455126 [Mortierella sp. GBAus27b]|nr:hypothetical protein B0O80DRAFT_455126 [Mortierella sp. GBAus27b]
MEASRHSTIQVSSEGTDDVVLAAPATEKLRHAATFFLSKPDFGAFNGQRQIRDFVNSCLINLSNHHSVDTTRILTDLASPHGRNHLIEILTKPMDVDTGDHKGILSFQFVIIPFIGVLTRECVCQSILMSESGAIYSTVYNYREAFLERGVMPCMNTLLDRGSMQDNSRGGQELARDKTICQANSMPRALLAITRLIYQLIKRIQDSKIAMSDVVEKLHQLQLKCRNVSSISDENKFLNDLLAREVLRLQKIVSDANDTVIRDVDSDDAAQTSRSSRGQGRNRIHLARVYDPPGTLSQDGPRHDNDHYDIQAIKVLPTQQEITATRLPFLPSNGIPDAPHFLLPGWKRQLDTHFRLYREDMLEPLRKGLQSFLFALQSVERGNEQLLLRQKDLRKLIQDDVSLNVYGNVQFKGMDCTRELGGSVEIAFGQPPQVTGMSLKKRADFWERSRQRLMQGSLVCIASRSMTPPNTEDPETFPPFQMVLGVVTKRDVNILAKEDKTARIHISLTDLKLYLNMLNSQSLLADQEQWFLVESTGGFFESYRPILAALQKCVPAALPFGKYLAPTEEESLAMLNNDAPVDPPLYARAPGFTYDLSILLKGHRLTLDATNAESANKAIEVLQKRSTMKLPDNEKPLDKTQASALVETLCREVALISGPPGTGKTKIGVDLMRVLLHNKQAMNCGPILCICYTNHALDQFLEHLLDDNITDIVRVGARSKSEKLEDYNLESLMKSRDRPFSVRQALKVAGNEWDEVSKRIQHLEKAFLSESLTWEYVQPYLMMRNPDQCDELETGPPRNAPQVEGLGEDEEEDDDDGEFTEVGASKGKKQHPFDRWATCADIATKERWNQMIQRQAGEQRQRGRRTNQNRFVALVDQDGMLQDAPNDGDQPPLRPQHIPQTDRPLRYLDGNVWEMSRSERKRLMDSWKPEVLGFMSGEMSRLLQDLENAKQAKNDAFNDFRRTILRQTSVIGMTTNGAAKHQSLVAAVAPKIIICEEAGEVLESHILAALSGSTQHLILIGDHLQLRPQIESFGLSSDSTAGKNYNLDMSLFERLVTAHKPFPLSHLTIQRRMRPEISSLIRNTLYPNLEDGQNVKEYPTVNGMGASLFFMDHSHAVDAKDEYGMQSFSNSFEVRMVEALAHYLIKNGYDKPGDIAIITPYLGQLSKLRDRLKKSFMLVIDERDQEQLDQKDLEREEAGHEHVNELVGVKNVSLQRHLTLRTIDNYQGEEAKIVIITLVRSDARDNGAQAKSNSIGFLKSPNRTNVLLSRAQHGMFLIGNADLMAKEKHGLWPTIIDELREFGRVGEGFPIVCKNHPYTTNVIDNPDMFRIVSPNGGCLAMCGCSMPCGHICPLHCHPDDRGHQLVKCIEPCMRLQPGCNHACPKMCGEKCGDCMEYVSAIVLPCGHVYERPRCYQRKDPSTIVCKVKTTRALPTCEHEHVMDCSRDPAKIRCEKSCDALLPCGDLCKHPCFECQKRSPGSKNRDGPLVVVPRTDHGKCTKPCGRNHFCGHACDSTCHEGSDCPPCKQKCAVACTHFRCHLPCEVPCAACCQPCVWECTHQGKCPLPCGAPCDRLPCDRRCDKKLSCGHQCPSICGEKCPPKKFCVECKDPQTMEAIVDFIMQESLSEVNVNEDPILVMDCGHALTMTSMDGLMEMSEYYQAQENTRTGEVQYVAKKELPDGEVSQVPCHLCRKPIVGLLRYGRRIKYGQLSMRLKKYQMAQSKEMDDSQQKLRVAQARIEQHRTDIINAIMAIPDGRCIEPPTAAQRMLGKFKPGEVFPQTPAKTISIPYNIPEKHQELWSKMIRDAMKCYHEFKAININNRRSPFKQLFDAAVSHLYRAKTTASFDVSSNTITYPLMPSENATPSEIIEACIQECGLPRDGYCGSAFVNSLHECTNILTLIVAPAFTIAGKMEATSGWYWFVEDLLECALTHANMFRDAAIQGRYERQESYARVSRMDVICKMVQLMGQKPVPSDKEEKKAKLKKVDELTDQFMVDMKALKTHCPQGIRADCIRRADEMDEKMASAIRIARGEREYTPLTKDEKIEIFRAMNQGLQGSGHWYRCINGHTYVIANCGMAMMEAQCPECGATVGGGHHTLREDNAPDTEFEEMYRQRARGEI